MSLEVFPHFPELAQAVLDLIVKLLDLVLVHLLSALLQLNVIHSHLIVFVQDLQLLGSLLLLLLKLSLSLHQLRRLLLQLCEDHGGVNHLLNTRRKRSLINLDLLLFLLDLLFCLRGHLVINCEIVLLITSSFNAHNLLDETLHLGRLDELARLVRR